ncbi:hypothetical protein BX666DRAFT_1975491 [Dichotomocladium elegans]|nr:hypothetical protein BX666DRAFT_1975491 [Dichotomocladium elegans]
MSHEYTHLLTTQLDSQRIYYNDLLDETTAQLSAMTKQVTGLYSESHTFQLENNSLVRQNNETEATRSKLHDENITLARRLDTYKEHYGKYKQELIAEKQVKH